MRAFKTFEDFLKEGIIYKINIDKERARSLIIESERKFTSLNEQLEKIGIKNENANDYIEYCYDTIMYLIRAKLFLEGYSSSGIGAHEAEISYLRILKFSENNIQFADQMRYLRNRILYYGTALDKEYAEKVVEFINHVYPKLKEMIIKQI